MLQICRLLRGFTHPGTYFEASEQELALYSVERFANEMDTLLEITLRSNLVEKLSKALYKCLFEDDEDEEEIDESKVDRYGQLEEYDHIAVASVHAFLQVKLSSICTLHTQFPTQYFFFLFSLQCRIYSSIPRN